MTADGPLEVWGATQARQSARHMAMSVSATGLVKHRPGFSQTVRPAPGSVLAAPMETDPDYFFHWVRDSAAVMDAVRILIAQGDDAADWRRHFTDFVGFSLGLRQISGPRFLAAAGDFRRAVAPDMLQFVRPDAEIAAVDGELIHGDVRYNADGTLDFLHWGRPQYDGPTLRALVCMRYAEQGFADVPGLGELIRGDLDFTRAHAGEPCFDIWEEECARHYYTLLLQYAALRQGAKMQSRRAAEYWAKAEELSAMLAGYWLPEQGNYRSRIFPHGGGESPKALLDFAVIIGVVHAGLTEGAHSVRDERVLSTFGKLEALFGRLYAINRGRADGIAFGRYEGDTYFSGGPWYFCTWGAAEFCYRVAAAQPGRAREFLARGDAILERTRATIPATGEMTEQFDPNTGAQTSAPNLAWSHASFLTAWQAREAAVAAVAAAGKVS